MKLPTDLTGSVFGLLTVTAREGTTTKGRPLFSTWRCQCSCGQTLVVSRREFHRGKRYCSISRHKDDHRRHLLLKRADNPKPWDGHELTMTSWRAMLGRCHPDRRYGKKGITVCPEWVTSFETFLADMGDRPSKDHSIDRIDTFGNYEPGNCRWATLPVQLLNKRTTRWIEWRGERRRLAEVTQELGLDLNLVGCRLRIGWSIEKALLQPVKRYKVKPISPVEAELRRMSDERVEKLMGEK